MPNWDGTGAAQLQCLMLGLIAGCHMQYMSELRWRRRGGRVATLRNAER